MFVVHGNLYFVSEIKSTHNRRVLADMCVSVSILWNGCNILALFCPFCSNAFVYETFLVYVLVVRLPSWWHCAALVLLFRPTGFLI